MPQTPVDWAVVATLAAPLVTFLLGIGATLWLGYRQRLVVYVTNIAGFIVMLGPPDEKNVEVSTFSLVIRNAGRRATSNVKIGHHHLPKDVAIYPAIPHEIDTTAPGTAAEARIEQLVSGEQITISYLLWGRANPGQIIAYVKSDDGQARVLNTLPTPQWPKLTLWILWFLVVVGAVSILYLTYSWIV